MSTSSTTATRTQAQGNCSTPARKLDDMQPTADLIEYAKTYAREKPEVAALWCLGIGFVLGWKLKPW